MRDSLNICQQRLNKLRKRAALLAQENLIVSKFKQTYEKLARNAFVVQHIIPIKLNVEHTVRKAASQRWTSISRVCFVEAMFSQQTMIDYYICKKIFSEYLATKPVKNMIYR